jgi:hypothetical protein
VKEVFSDDYSGGVGLYTATFEKPALVKPSVVAKELGRYKLERLRARITAPVASKDGALWAAGYKLAKEEGVDVQPGKTFALTGVVTEDEKGGLTLTLTKAVAKE